MIVVIFSPRAGTVLRCLVCGVQRCFEHGQRIGDRWRWSRLQCSQRDAFRLEHAHGRRVA